MTTAGAISKSVEGHYSKSDLGNAILAALQESGKDIAHLKLEDLEPVDEFHVRRGEATRELARRAGIREGMRVLDIGCGIGGPARTMAHEFGARVTGIDLIEEYCRAATLLTERVGLSHRVTFRQANALDLPFENASFDVVWTQHASMNIPDKARLYGECFRVLKAGGTLAIYDILGGPAGPVNFPVPWARTPETSFLVAPSELRSLLEAAGFRVTLWEDRTSAALEWFASLSKRIQQGGLPPLGTHLLVGGSDYPEMARNQVRNLQQGRIVLAEILARKSIDT